MQMRILHVVPTYLPAVRYGGPIFAVHGLCRALAARGHHIEVFTTNVDGSGTTSVPIGKSVSVDGVQVRYFSCPLLRRIYLAPALTRALQREVTTFDIVHLHSVFLWPTWAAARAARKAGIPYVLSPRGMLVRDLIVRKNRLVKSAWIELIEKSNLKHAAALHLTSDLEALELKRFGWQLPRRAVIPNGIDDPIPRESAIRADVKEMAAEQPLVLFLGRLSWKKGLERLLHAFAYSSSGTLAIAGTDDENYAPWLMQLAENLRIAERVRILPRTLLGVDKEELFAAARVFALPSYSENFGNTVLEAMRRGVPVVVTPEVGAAEIVQRSGGGLVVEGSPEPLGAAIASLVEDRELARSMGQAGQRHVVAHYNWATIATQMETLYSGVRLDTWTVSCSNKSHPC